MTAITTVDRSPFYFHVKLNLFNLRGKRFAIVVDVKRFSTFPMRAQTLATPFRMGLPYIRTPAEFTIRGRK